MKLPPLPQPAGLSRVLARIDAIKGRFRPPRAHSWLLTGQLAQIFGRGANFAQVLSSAGAPSARQATFAVHDALTEAAVRHQLDPDLLLAVAESESGLRPDAVSPRGARGLMQIMPGTAGRLGLTDPFDLQANADAGARYLKEQLDRFGGNIALALAAYNAGPGAVLRYRGIPPYQETRAFVSRVLAMSGLPAPPGASGLQSRNTPPPEPTSTR
jgi:soluble lytic murein transglycosylase-like protein